MRVALYFTPPIGDALTRAAAAWLGRDPFTGEPVHQEPGSLDADELLSLTKPPARYGFHATLKAPFHLEEGNALADLEAAVQAYCEDKAPVILPKLVLRRIGRFFALVPDRPLPTLQELAADIVRFFDPYRAPLSDSELAKRRKAGLTPTQNRNLQDWGYPYIFDEFQYHMTLTGPVCDEQAGRIRQELMERFQNVIGSSLSIDSMAIYVEPAAGLAFRVHRRVRFGQISGS